MDRRNLVAEPWLENLIIMLDRRQRTNIFQSVERCEELGKRRAVEIKHFVDGPNSLDRNKEVGSTHSLLQKGMIPGIIYGKGSEPKLSPSSSK